MCFRDTGFTLRNPKRQSDDNEIQTYRILKHGLIRLQKVRTAIYYCQDVMFIKARLCRFVEINKTIIARVPVNFTQKNSRALKINATQST